jgi:hypothetical protein
VITRRKQHGVVVTTVMKPTPQNNNNNIIIITTMNHHAPGLSSTDITNNKYFVQVLSYTVIMFFSLKSHQPSSNARREQATYDNTHAHNALDAPQHTQEGRCKQPRRTICIEWSGCNKEEGGRGHKQQGKAERQER